MTEQAAFIRAICTDPDDDTARLVYADWLDEHGEPERAEFIRVQVKLAGLERQKVALFNDETDWSQCTGIAASWCPNCGYCCCRNREESMSDDDCPLHSEQSRHSCADMLTMRIEQAREREWKLFTPDWLPDFGGQLREWYFSCYPADYRPDRPFSFVVSRGFVSSITCIQEQFLAPGVAAGIFGSHPVTWVVLTGQEPRVLNQSGTCRWYCHHEEITGDENAVLAEELFVLLPGAKWEYPSTQLALESLSAACVSHGRKLAGLPALRIPSYAATASTPVE